MNEGKRKTSAWIYIGIAGVPGALAVVFGVYVACTAGTASTEAAPLLWVWLALTAVSAGCGVIAAVLFSRCPALRRAQQEAGEAALKLFQLRLLRGETVGEEEWRSYIGGLAPEMGRYYALAFIALCPEENGSAAAPDGEERANTVCRRLLREMTEPMKKALWLPPVCIADGSIAVLFTGEEEGELLDRINAYYRELETLAAPLWKAGIRMGISAVHSGRGHFREACQESIRALMLCRAQEEENGEPAGSRFFAPEGAEGIFDFRYAQEIQKGLKGIDRILCGQALDGFEGFLKKTAGKEEEIIYILQFVNAVLSVALETGLDLHSLCPGGLIALCDDLLWMPEPARVRRLVESRLVDPVLRMRSELLEKGARSMMEDVERLIRERQGNITLTECAFALQVHPSYIWKLLKTERGKSFSDYLEEYKLEEAKRLLLETDLTVAQIAARLNYTNAQNFIRFFSKSTGITPGKFRRQE